MCPYRDPDGAKVPFKERIHKIFKLKEGKKPEAKETARMTSKPEPRKEGQGAIQTNSAAASTTLSSTSKSPSLGPISIELWNDAYQDLKKEQEKLVTVYEKVLIGQATGTSSLDLYTTLQNCSGQIRVQIMTKIVHKLQDRNEQHENLRSNIIQAVEFVDRVKDYVNSALQAYPPAALAFSGLCLVAPVLVLPLKQTEAMIDGLRHVIQRLDWYMGLSQLLLRDNYRGDMDFTIFQRAVRKMIIELYKGLLEYQMKAACRCYDSLAITNAIKAMIGAEDWGKRVTNLKIMEARVQTDLISYNDQIKINVLSDSSKLLGGILDALKEVTDLLGARLPAGAQWNTEQNLVEQRRLTAKFATDYLTWMRINRLPFEGTGRWFENHPKFRKWLQDESGVLLVSADPGCGKSVLSRNLVEKFLPTNCTDATVCYFFFKEQAQQRHVNTGMCSLLHQLLSRHGECALENVKQIDEAGERLNSNREVLWNILQRTFNAIGERCKVICVLDAIDEMDPEDLQWMSQKLKEYYAVSTDGKPRILLTTRGYGEILDQFDGLQSNYIRLEGENADELDQIQCEIDIVIKHRLASLQSSKLLDDDVVESISTALQNKSTVHRTYLYVTTVFTLLEEDESGYETTAYWTSLVNEIPRDLIGAYELLLKNVKSTYQEDVRVLFSVILAAARPLTSSELNSALAARKQLLDNPKEYLRTTEDLKYMRSEKKFDEWVRRVCRCFLSIYRGTVYFIHQTVKEFLLGTSIPLERIRSDSRDWKWYNSFTTKTADAVLAECCIAYLSIDCMKAVPLFEPTEEISSLQEYAFKETSSLQEYASIYAMQHLRRCQIFTFKDDQRIPYTVRDIEDQFRARLDLDLHELVIKDDLWFRHYPIYMMDGLKRGSEVDQLVSRMLSSTSRIVNLALTGCFNLVLIELNNTQTVDSEIASLAVISAAYGNSPECLELLLKRGCAAMPAGKLRSLNGRTALHWAAFWCSKPMIKMLTKAGADVNASFGKLAETPVHLCVHQMDMLSFPFSDVEVSIARRYASIPKPYPEENKNWNESLFKLFYDVGANMDAGLKHHSPLWVACYNGDFASVRHLLQGCKVNTNREVYFKNDEYHSLLSRMLRSQPSDELITLLLRSGLDIRRTREDDDFRNITPLHDLLYFWEGKDITILQLILKEGQSFVNAKLESAPGSSENKLRSMRAYTALTDAFEGWTPLHCCSVRRGLDNSSIHEIIKLLCAYGADINAKDVTGRTPYDYVCEYGNHAHLEAFLANGADSSDSYSQEARFVHRQANPVLQYIPRGDLDEMSSDEYEELKQHDQQKMDEEWATLASLKAKYQSTKT